MSNPSLESFAPSIKAYSNQSLPAGADVRVSLAGAVAADVAAGDIVRSLGGALTEDFSAQVMRYCRLLESDAKKFARTVPTEIHLGFGLDIDEEECIELLAENDAKADVLDPGLKFWQVTPAQQLEIMTKTFGVPLTGTITWPGGAGASGVVTAVGGAFLSEVVAGQDSVVQDADGRTFAVTLVTDDNTMTIANPGGPLTGVTMPSGVGSGTTFFDSQTPGLSINALIALATQFMRCVKASYFLNFPQHTVRTVDLGLGNGVPLFSDSANEISNPNDPFTVSAFNFRSWPYPIRFNTLPGSNQVKGMETRLRDAFLSANGDLSVSAAESNTEFNNLLSDWTARNLLWQ